MSPSDPLNITYQTHERVQELVAVIRYCLEDISLQFEQWGEPYVTGPGLYAAVVSGYSVSEYADPMGDNHWPVDDCYDVLADMDNFYAVTNEVALTRDGAVVISVDGIIHEQMVRFRHRFSDEHTVMYSDWMGSRHMSALDMSVRPDVVATITLSAETGRVTLFEDGEYDTTLREEIPYRWY